MQLSDHLWGSSFSSFLLLHCSNPMKSTTTQESQHYTLQLPGLNSAEQKPLLMGFLDLRIRTHSNVWECFNTTMSTTMAVIKVSWYVLCVGTAGSSRQPSSAWAWIALSSPSSQSIPLHHHFLVWPPNRLIVQSICRFDLCWIHQFFLREKQIMTSDRKIRCPGLLPANHLTLNLNPYTHHLSRLPFSLSISEDGSLLIVMLQFVPSDAAGLPVKRQHTQLTCASCRRKKVRSYTYKLRGSFFWLSLEKMRAWPTGVKSPACAAVSWYSVDSRYQALEVSIAFTAGSSAQFPRPVFGWDMKVAKIGMPKYTRNFSFLRVQIELTQSSDL